MLPSAASRTSSQKQAAAITHSKPLLPVRAGRSGCSFSYKSKKAIRNPDGFWSGKRDLSPLCGRRAFHVAPQSATPTAPSGSGSRVQAGNCIKKSHPESGWLLERKTRLEPAMRATRLPRRPSVGYADSSLGERVASSSRKLHQKKAIRNPDGFWSGKRDLNSRPRPWQGRALPTELFPQTCYPQHRFGITKVALFSFPANFF